MHVIHCGRRHDESFTGVPVIPFRVPKAVSSRSPSEEVDAPCSFGREPAQLWDAAEEACLTMPFALGISTLDRLPMKLPGNGTEGFLRCLNLRQKLCDCSHATEGRIWGVCPSEIVSVLKLDITVHSGHLQRTIVQLADSVRVLRGSSATRNALMRNGRSVLIAADLRSCSQVLKPTGTLSPHVIQHSFA